MNFSRHDDTKLCALVSNYPSLYDYSHPKFKDILMKDGIWKEIVNSFSGKTDEDCKKRWRSIRDHYKRLKREGKLETRSATRKGTNWPLLKHLSFLTDIPEERRSRPNISKFEEDNSNVNDDSVPDEQSDSGANARYNDPSSVHSPSTSDTSYAPQRKKKTRDRVTEILIKNNDSRKKIIETLHKMKTVEDDVDVFYKSIAISVKRLPPDLIAEAKIQHLQILNDLELKYRQNQ